LSTRRGHRMHATGRMTTIATDMPLFPSGLCFKVDAVMEVDLDLDRSPK
jgi:hypothetical protein